MKNKKKRGNSLILVLAMAFIFTTIGGVVVTAIMSTSRLNQNSKVHDDLVYAAESGLESALSRLSGRNIGSVSHEQYNVPIQLTNTIDRVEVVMDPETKPDGKKVIQVESTSYSKDGGERKTVGCEIEDKSIPITNNGRNIFEYSVVASAQNGVITNSGAGSQNWGSSVVNANGGVNFTNGIKPSESNTDSNYYADLVMNNKMKKADKVVVPAGSTGDVAGCVINETIGTGAVDITNYINGTVSEMPNIKSGIAEFTISPYAVGTATGHPIKVLIVNADSFEIYDRTILTNTYSVVISTGNINMYGNASVNLSYSTMYGKNIYVNDSASLHVNFPLDNPGVGTIDFDILNDKIGKVITNWNDINGGVNSGGGGGSSTPDYGFVDGSFEYQ